MNAKAFLPEGVIIDDEDIERVSKYRWRLMKASDNGKKRVTGYPKGNRNAGDFYLHRFILGLEKTGAKIQVDHINRNALDNRKCNLRIVNGYINAMNRDKQSNNTSGIVGVCYDKRTERKKHWVARIYIYGKETHLGYFETKEEAILARKKAEKEFWNNYNK